MSIVSGIELNKHTDNEFVITIKKSKALTPITISNFDTFTVMFVRLSDNEKIATLTSDESNTAGYVYVSDSVNGKITIVMKEAFVNSLESKRGSGSDNYYSVPTYKLVISAETQDNGKILAKIDNVKVV